MGWVWLRKTVTWAADLVEWEKREKPNTWGSNPYYLRVDNRIELQCCNLMRANHRIISGVPSVQTGRLSGERWILFPIWSLISFSAFQGLWLRVTLINAGVKFNYARTMKGATSLLVRVHRNLSCHLITSSSRGWDMRQNQSLTLQANPFWLLSNEYPNFRSHIRID